MKRIVISDTHIGSRNYREEELLNFLNSIEYDELILAGDIIDFLEIPFFTGRVIDLIKAINFKKSIIYIVGNHDYSLRGFVGKELYGVKFLDKYDFEDNGVKIRIEHGDAYDLSIVRNNYVMAALTCIRKILAEKIGIDIEEIWHDFILRRRKLRKIWDILKWNSEADIFIIGHFHIPETVIWTNEKDEVKTYINCGDWTSACTYIQIENGIAKLKKYI